MTGGTPKRSIKEYFDGGTINWLVSGDVHKKKIFECNGRITELGLANSNARILPKDTVVIALNGQGKTRGTVAILRVEAACNQSIVCMNPKDRNQLDPEFLYRFLDGSYKKIRGITGDKDGRGLNMPLLRKIRIPLPPLPEQKRIVAILDEAFEGIDAAVAGTEKNLANARELFESYLNAVFTRKGEGEVPLSELATDITDGDHSPPPKAPSGVPFITISDIMKDTREIDFSGTFHVHEDYFRALKFNKKPKIGDVLYTVTGATLGIPVLVKRQMDFCFQRHIGLIRPKPDVDSVWLSYALLSPKVFRQATAGSTGAAQKTVSLRVLRNLQLPKMSFPEQQKIADYLDSLSEKSRHLQENYERKLGAFADLKQSILQKAFSVDLTSQPEKILDEAVA